MPRAEEQSGFLPSVLDRLLDPEAGGSGRRGYSVAQLTEAVRRDLEALLNTRRNVADWPSDFEELSNSVLAYGLPDLSQFNANAPREREELAWIITDAILRFEPRLRDVRVSLRDEGKNKMPKVHFHIEALLHMEPALTVGFETVLDVPEGHAAVLASE